MKQTYENMTDELHQAIRLARNIHKETGKSWQNAYLVIMRATCAAIRAEQPSMLPREVLAEAAKRYANIDNVPLEAEVTDATAPTEASTTPTGVPNVPRMIIIIIITITYLTRKIIHVDQGNYKNDNMDNNRNHAIANHTFAYCSAGSKTQAGKAMMQAHGADAEANRDKKSPAPAKAKATRKAIQDAEAQKSAKAKIAEEKKVAKAEAKAKARGERTERMKAMNEARRARAATAATSAIGPAADEP
jgi:hypothetical protein